MILKYILSELYAMVLVPTAIELIGPLSIELE